MYFFIKKILGMLLMPQPLTVIAVVLGLLLLKQKWFPRFGKYAGRACLLLSFFLVVFFGNVGVCNWMFIRMETRYAAQPEFSVSSPVPEKLAACKYVIVLGNGYETRDDRSSVNKLYPGSLHRLAEGLRIATALPDAKLVLSGGGWDGRSTVAREYEHAALSLGFPAERIIRFDHTADTRDEIESIKKLAGGMPVAVATSAYHIPRAMALCRELGVEAVACPSGYLFMPASLGITDFFQWSFNSLGNSAIWFHEWLGRLAA